MCDDGSIPSAPPRRRRTKSFGKVKIKTKPLTTDEINSFNAENCSVSQNHCLNENHQEYKIDENRFKEKPVPLPRPGSKMPKVKPTPKPRSFSVSHAVPRGNLDFSAKQKDAPLEEREAVMKLQGIKRNISSLGLQNNINKNIPVFGLKEKPALKEKPKLAKPKLPAKPKIAAKPKVPDKSTDLLHKRTQTKSLNNETKSPVEIKNRSQSTNTYNSSHNSDVNENLTQLSKCTLEEELKEQESNNNEKIQNPTEVCVNGLQVECHDMGKQSRAEQQNEPEALSSVICDRSSDKNDHKEQIIETNTVFQDTGAKSENVKNNRSNAEDTVVDSVNSDQDVIHENVIKNLDEVVHLACKSKEQVVQTSSTNLSGVNEIKNMKEISDSNPKNTSETLKLPSNNLEETNEVTSDYEEMTEFTYENSVEIRNFKNITEISKNSLKETQELDENKSRNPVETDENTESQVDETSDDEDHDDDDDDDRSTFFKERALSSNDLIESLICPSYGRSTLNSRKFQLKTTRSQSLVDLDDIARPNSNSSHGISKTLSLAPAKKYRNHDYENTEIYVKKRNREQMEYENVEINIETIEESRLNQGRLDISEQSGSDYMTPMSLSLDTNRNKIIRFSGDIGLISHPRTNPKNKDPNQSGVETSKHFNIDTFSRDLDLENNANNSNTHESHSIDLSSKEPYDSHLSNKVYADSTHSSFNQEPQNLFNNTYKTEKDLIKTENIDSGNISKESKVTGKTEELGESIYDAPRSDVSEEQNALTDSSYSTHSLNDLKEKGTHKNLSHSKTLPISTSKKVFDFKKKGKYIVTLEEDNPLYNSSGSTGSENSYKEQRYTRNVRKVSPVERRPDHGNVEKKRSLDSNVPHQQHSYEDVEFPSNFQGAGHENMYETASIPRQDSSSICTEISKELLSLQHHFVHSVDIVRPGREILKSGALQKLSRKGPQQRTFILLNDALLYCAQEGKNQLKLIAEFLLADMSVENADSEDLKNEFSVITTKRSFLLNASSQEEKDDWVQALRSAINECDQESKSISSLQLTGDGCMAPPWIPDNRVSMCQICTVKFTVTNRRHHCRACGKVACNKCSAYEAPLKYMNNNTARVCEQCYKQLLQNLQMSDKDSNETLKAKFKDLKPKKKGKNRERPKTMQIKLDDYSMETTGFLTIKKGKKDKRYWYVLKNHTLSMYKAFSDPIASETTAILGYDVVQGGDWENGDYTFYLSHRSSRIENMVFRADDIEAAKRWVDYLRLACSIG